MEQIKINYNELSTFNFPMDEKFSLSVMYKNIEYGFLAHFKYNDKIICLEYENTERNTPDDSSSYLNKIDEKVNASFIWYNVHTSDSDDINNVGCIGNQNEYYLRNIRDILVKLATRIHLTNEDLFFYGNSTRAFTSIQLATMIKDSTAIANNPILFLQNHPQFNQIIQNALPGMSQEEITEKYLHRFDVLNMMIKEDYIPKTILIFNFDDKNINTQYINFIQEIDQLKNILNNENKIKTVLSSDFNTDEEIRLLNGILSKNLMCYVNELEDSDIYKENSEFKKDNEELKEVLSKWGEDSCNKIDLELEINRLSRENEEKDELIEDISKQLEEKQKELDELLVSHSWKITKPLRKGMNIFKK